MPPDVLELPGVVRRVALWVPDWPVAAAVAEGLVGAHEPVAVHDGRGVVVASAAARAQGVRRGMRRRTAQSACPELVLLGVDDARDVRAFEPVVQAVEEVVAGVEVARPGVLLMAARGPSRHVGSEEALAEALVGVVARDSGAECQVGIGDGLLTAVLAARSSVLVPPGTPAARAFLAPHDVRVLDYVAGTRRLRAELADLVDLLRRLGLRTLGALAGLPTGDVAARFGSLGVLAHRLARGADLTPPVARRPEQDVLVRADLDPPAERADVAAFVARGLAEELAERLARRGAVCGRLTVTARTEDGGELVRTWRLDGAPTAPELTDRVRWQLEGWLSGRSDRPPSAPLTRLELTAEEVSPAGAVSDGLWGRRGRGEVQAERAALRVQGLLGPEGVLVPVLQGGRDPRSRARLVVWGDEPAPLRRVDAPWPGHLPAPSPATVPAQPRQVEVLDGEGRPVGVDARGAMSGDPAHVVDGGERLEVLGWAGPWPMVERWWAARPEERRRRAWLQVSVARSPALLLALADGAWWVEGVYD
ncbi:Y-family DNA polymerase [Georgenia faecalis]|uniref:DNA polymerase Y family protein n=1 Tax=Georgenia faecalis TaxID=2483799 RepID=A0ABV9DDS3_9MICO|nr:DNA polymerase Y family protein [Georgenia faecalis]